jgi:hypothetical protein
MTERTPPPIQNKAETINMICIKIAVDPSRLLFVKKNLVA